MAANEEADWSSGQGKLDHSQQQPMFSEVSLKKLAGQNFECDHGDKLRCKNYRCDDQIRTLLITHDTMMRI